MKLCYHIKIDMLNHLFYSINFESLVKYFIQNYILIVKSFGYVVHKDR